MKREELFENIDRQILIEKIYRKKVRVEDVWRSKYDDYEDSMELCRVGYYHDEIIRADQPCQEYDL